MSALTKQIQSQIMPLRPSQYSLMSSKQVCQKIQGDREIARHVSNRLWQDGTEQESVPTYIHDPKLVFWSKTSVVPMAHPSAFDPQVLSLFGHRQPPHKCCQHHLQWQGARSMSIRSASDNGASAVADTSNPFSQAVMTDTGRILDTELPDELQKSYLSVSLPAL